MRVLKSAVAVGGVVYPAGTRSTPDLAEAIAERHWSGEAADEASGAVAESPEYRALAEKFEALGVDYEKVTAAYKVVRETAEQLVIERDAALARAEKAEADLSAAALGAAETSGADATASPLETAEPGGDPAAVKRTRQRARTTPGQG